VGPSCERASVKDRNVAAFDRRAAGYESGAIGQMHQRIVKSVADVALTIAPNPRRVLDVGCGTGAMLRLLASRLPDAEALVRSDPAPSMLRTAAAPADIDPRISFRGGVAEDLPFPNDEFDLQVSTTSFDHWANQSRGLAECARVLRPGAPSALLTAAAFSSLTWHPALLIKTVVGT
jgi:ubiquinone/menaquinone biosynthesis C-methylase UbiE